MAQDPAVRGNRILLLEGHPAPSSQCHDVVLSLIERFEADGDEVRPVRLCDLVFEADPHLGQTGPMAHKPRPMDLDLERLWLELERCDRLVLVSPLWFGQLPGRLSLMFERLLQPGLAYIPLPDGSGMKPLLSGRRADLVFIPEAAPGVPGRYATNRLVRLAMDLNLYGLSFVHNLTRRLFHPLGIHPVSARFIAPRPRTEERGRGLKSEGLAMLTRTGGTPKIQKDQQRQEV